MADGGRQDVLGQKAQAAQRAFDARGMSPAKALRRALSRTADVLWDLALVTQSVTIEMHDQDGVIDGFGDGVLLILLDGPDGAIGVSSIDRDVMTGLVEVQTIQQVTQMPVDEDRIVTPTDAAMMAPLLDGALERMVANLADHPLVPQLQGFRFGAMIENARAASLLLEASSYRVFKAEVDLALGRRHGSMSFVLPDRKIRKHKGNEADHTNEPGPHAELLTRVPARLDAVLSRIRIPLSKAGALKTGDLLPLPPDALDKVEVLAGAGYLAAKGRLGQMNGLRAVRLNWPVLPKASSGDIGAAGMAAAFDEPVADLAPVGDLPDLSEETPIDMDFGSDVEELPDLPPLDFSSDVESFDLDAIADSEEAGELPDLGGDFASAPVEFDFED